MRLPGGLGVAVPDLVVEFDVVDGRDCSAALDLEEDPEDRALDDVERVLDVSACPAVRAETREEEDRRGRLSSEICKREDILDSNWDKFLSISKGMTCSVAVLVWLEPSPELRGFLAFRPRFPCRVDERPRTAVLVPKILE